jgi:hypothetical protein
MKAAGRRDRNARRVGSSDKIDARHDRWARLAPFLITHRAGAAGLLEQKGTDWSSS